MLAVDLSLIFKCTHLRPPALHHFTTAHLCIYYVYNSKQIFFHSLFFSTFDQSTYWKVKGSVCFECSGVQASREANLWSRFIQRPVMHVYDLSASVSGPYKHWCSFGLHTVILRSASTPSTSAASSCISI